MFPGQPDIYLPTLFAKLAKISILRRSSHGEIHMKQTATANLACSIVIVVLALGTVQPAWSQANTPPPVAYSSVSQLNALLSQLEEASQADQIDLAKLRIDKWKTDGGSKRQAQANVESLRRNLQ